MHGSPDSVLAPTGVGGRRDGHTKLSMDLDREIKAMRIHAHVLLVYAQYVNYSLDTHAQALCFRPEPVRLCGMRPEDFVKAVRECLQASGQSRYRAAVSHDLPRDAIRRVLEGQTPRLDRAAEICRALGLEFYIGPPRPHAQGLEAGRITGASLHDLEAGARTLNRIVVDAGGNPISDDLWPVLAVRHAGLQAIPDSEDIPPKTRPVPIVELAVGAEELGDKAIGNVWFCKSWLDSHGLDPTRCVVIRASDESMEPLLSAGASILVDRERCRRIRDRLFVVRTEAGILVRRAGHAQDGDWMLVSGHPAWESVPWAEDTEIIGQVVWMARSLM